VPFYDAGIVANPGLARAESWSDSVRVRLNGMPADDVKALYVECGSEAAQRRLGSGEAAFCSIVYDVLLQRHFDGRFEALLAWSRQQHAAGRSRSGAAAPSIDPTAAATIAMQRGGRH
jgi:hypothetical protein